MPYKVVKQGNKWVLKKKDTGKVVGHSDSEEKAMASMRARMMAEDRPEKMHKK